MILNINSAVSFTLRSNFVRCCGLERGQHIYILLSCAHGPTNTTVANARYKRIHDYRAVGLSLIVVRQKIIKTPPVSAHRRRQTTVTDRQIHGGTSTLRDSGPKPRLSPPQRPPLPSLLKTLCFACKHSWPYNTQWTSSLPLGPPKTCFDWPCHKKAQRQAWVLKSKGFLEIVLQLSDLSMVITLSGLEVQFPVVRGLLKTYALAVLTSLWIKVMLSWGLTHVFSLDVYSNQLFKICIYRFNIWVPSFLSKCSWSDVIDL